MASSIFITIGFSREKASLFVSPSKLIMLQTPKRQVIRFHETLQQKEHHIHTQHTTQRSPISPLYQQWAIETVQFPRKGARIPFIYLWQHKVNFAE